MELPKNGGIVIIDDQMEEALPLMNALSSKGVAYSYYDGQPRNYPKEPLTNIRLVFWICILMKLPLLLIVQEILLVR